MANFCGKCGSRLDKATGLCPKCDADKLNKHVQTPTPKQNTISESAKPLSKKEAKKKRKADKTAAKKDKKREKWATMTFGQKFQRLLLRLALWFFLIASFVSIITIGLLHHNIIQDSDIYRFLYFIGFSHQTAGSAEKYRVDAPDAEQYYQNNSTIITQIDANKSDDILTESETYAELTRRGFDQYPITTEYSMDGTYSDATDISNDSSDKHPIYQTYYVSDNGDLWTIFVINGSILANPVSYNLQSGRDVQVILSETDTVMSYDSTTNKFYETIPYESALVLITVDIINTETLNTLTAGEIDHYDYKT